MPSNVARQGRGRGGAAVNKKQDAVLALEGPQSRGGDCQVTRPLLYKVVLDATGTKELHLAQVSQTWGVGRRQAGMGFRVNETG